MAGRLLLWPLIRRDAEDGGSYRVRGTITEDGAVGARRVRLFDRTTGRLLREIWSGADGAYRFDRMAYREQGYIVLVHDDGGNGPGGQKNAVVADLVTPEPMP